MNARQEWLARRQSGIGGSDVAAILGLSPWKTPLDVYLSKVEPQQDEGDLSEAARWGNVLEPVVADEYALRTNRRVQCINSLIRRPGAEWMIANIDRAIVAPGTRARVTPDGIVAGANGVLEVKTTSAYLAGAWGREGDDEAIPLHYACQAMHYLAVTGLPWCDFAVLIGGQRFVTKRVDRDDETIHAITEKVGAFWHDNVLARRPPEPTNKSDLMRLFPQDSGAQKEATTEILQAYSRALQLRTQIKADERELEGLIERMQLFMGDASAIVLDADGGKRLATWKKAEDGKTTDWKAFAADLAKHANLPDATWNELIDAHTAPKPGTRRFIFITK